MTKNPSKTLILLICTYILLGISFALATPPLESSDEYKHYPVVHHIQNNHALPALDPENPGRWLQEGAQPPLYYLGAAVITSWIDTSDLPQIHQVNPHAFVGNTQPIRNKNLIIHQPNQTFPWRGSVLAVYVIRFASIASGIGTILLVAQLGNLLVNTRIGLLGAALTAFNPMFLFVSAAVNNDSLAILLGHLGIYLLVKIYQDAPNPQKQITRYLALGFVVGLGLLTKLSLGGLLGLVAIALAHLSWKHRDWRFILVGGLTVAFTALAMSGWWFIRNLSVYGDLTGLDAFIAVQGTRTNPITWGDWTAEFGTFFRTFWGLFGGVSIAAPELFYQGCNLLVVIGILGFAKQTNRTQLAKLGLPLTWFLILLLLLIRWNIIYTSFQGRLIFPALGILNLLWAAGLASWTSSKRRSWLALLACVFLLIAAILLPWLIIKPAYAFPDPLDQVPVSTQFGPISFASGNDVIQLVGVDVPPDQSVSPSGEPVKVTLFWRAPQSISKDYLTSVHLLGRDWTSVGQVNRYPAWGMIPTSQWQAGQIWQDTYLISVDENAQAPARLRINVSLYDTDAEQPIAAFAPDDSPIEIVLVGEAKLRANQNEEATPSFDSQSSFGDSIVLDGYDLQGIQITLYWRAKGNPAEDYTAFVHLLDQSGTLVGQGDGPPVNGDYPTSYWETGEVIIDEHPITLEPGIEWSDQYRLAIGLYRPQDGTRLPVWDSNCTPLPDNRVLIPIDAHLP